MKTCVIVGNSIPLDVQSTLAYTKAYWSAQNASTPIDLIFGPFCSSGTKHNNMHLNSGCITNTSTLNIGMAAIGKLAAAQNIPAIAHLSILSELSDRTIYPTVTRVRKSVVFRTELIYLKKCMYEFVLTVVDILCHWIAHFIVASAETL